MKKLLQILKTFILSIVGIILGLALLSITAKAATTGVLELRGLIPEILSVNVNQTVTDINLEIEETIQIAEVTEISNLQVGYKIALTSLNSGVLRRVGSSEVIPYTLIYDDLQADLSVPSGIVKTSSNMGQYVSTVSVFHQANIRELTIAGEYTDTITIEIERN